MLSIEAFVRIACFALAGKVPSKEPLELYLRLINSETEVPRGLVKFLNSLAKSPDFRNHRLISELENQTNFLIPDQSGTAFSDIIPLGNFCHAAAALKNVGYRNQAFPFDWLFSSPEMITSCIEDDFLRFLDRSEYQAVPLEQRHDPNSNFCRHLGFQKDYGISYVFNHHNPEQEKDYQFFQRAVERFRRVLDSPNWKLYLQVNAGKRCNASNSHLLSTLRKRTKNFVFVSIEFISSNQRDPASMTLPISCSRPSHDSLHIELQTESPSNGVIFQNAKDNLYLQWIIKSFRKVPSVIP
jgi:hypothetical protein